MRELGEKLGVIHSWVGKVEQGEAVAGHRGIPAHLRGAQHWPARRAEYC